MTNWLRCSADEQRIEKYKARLCLECPYQWSRKDCVDCVKREEIEIRRFAFVYAINVLHFPEKYARAIFRNGNQL